MKGLRFLKRAALGLACAGILAPPTGVQAAGPQQEVAAKSQARKIQPVDLELAGKGLARGQVVDSQGIGIAGTVVSVRYQNKEVARTVTDKNGHFAVDNLRGGVHTVAAANGTGLYRFWSEKTAPPKSRDQVLVVADAQVVRAQNCDNCDDGGLGGIDIITGATLGLSVAALVVAIDTNQKVDDLPNNPPPPPASP